MHSFGRLRDRKSGGKKWIAGGATMLALMVLMVQQSAQPSNDTSSHRNRLASLVGGRSSHFQKQSSGSGGNAGDDVVQRFHWAVSYIKRTQDLGVYPVWTCPNEFQLGRRPAKHTSNYVGTPCEPWIVRPLVTLLHELLLPGTAKALEWSSGSSTVWLLLGHVRHLTSIEHDQEWSAETVKKIGEIFNADFLKEHWDMHHIPVNSGVPADPSNPDGSLEQFSNYVAASFLGKSHIATFDYVSIDGRARAHCFPLALELIKPHGGVLLLDNSERTFYQPGVDLVPKHWLKFEVLNRVGKTTVWVSCYNGQCGDALPF